MPISINAILPVVTAQEAVPDLALQPGTVIDARVLKVLDDGHARIAIGGLNIDVLTEVPLQAGAALQLAVSETVSGLRLAIMSSSDATLAAGAATDVSAIAGPRQTVPATAPVLTPVEQLAVTTAAQAAAARQAGLSSLFANVTAAAPSLPASLQQAAQQLLAVRPVLSADLSGDALKSAFQGSGLFLEAGLAAGAAPAASQGMPDLKAALIVFRATLGSWLDQAPEQGAAATATAAAATARAATAAPPPGASLVPEIDTEEVYLPKALLPVAEEFVGGRILSSGTGAEAQSTAARVAAATAALNLLQDINGAVPAGVVDTLRRMVGGKLMLDPAQALSARPVPPDDPGAPASNLPPPPLRGGAPAAQPVASPTIGADATPAEAVRRLAGDADGAIARQTLLQIASLPDRAEAGRVDPGQPRWQFEIPFATPQGTAVAQFEISRDGNGAKAASASQRVWRARFSLDIEPAGPVHALVTLSGDTTSVRMWAERAETAARLRANAGELGQALRQAELEPGDIVIGSGAPPPASPPAPAGHFLDRAT